ncbi:MAG: TolC family protein [candidate division WOR-3 bacterium]|nr:TolC family protein [candidate division WOR-3 bacterium]
MKNKTLIIILATLLISIIASAQVDTLQLDVDLAVELALKNNYAVQLAKAKLKEAAAGKGMAFGSFLPQISASGTYYRTGTVNEIGFAKYGEIPFPVIGTNGDTIGYTAPILTIVGETTFGLGSADNYILRGTAQQTLFTWGKLINAYRITGLSFNIEQEAFRQAQAQTRVQAVEGFYGALLSQKMAELMQESYDQLSRHVSQVQQLYDNGLARRLDLMRAKVGLTNTQVQLKQMENTAKLALASLRTTLGLRPDTPIVLSGDLEFQLWNVDLTQAIDSALVKRPELLQLRKTIQIADLSSRIALTANLPTAFAQFNYDYKKPVGFEPEWGTDWNLTVGLTMPIFTGLSNWHKIKQAKARQRQSRLAVAMLEDGVRLEVQALVNTLNQELENITAQDENVKVAEEAYKIAETSYQNGLITNLEYLDTQLALLQSRVSYLNSLANYRIAKAKLQKAMGEF